MSTDRKLWLDTRGVPVITTSPNGERNARRWGWTPAVASAVTEGDIARIAAELTEGDWTTQDLVDALWAEVSGENRRREDAAVIYVDPPYGTSIPMDELHARSLATRNDTLTRRYVTDPEVVR